MDDQVLDKVFDHLSFSEAIEYHSQLLKDSLDRMASVSKQFLNCTSTRISNLASANELSPNEKQVCSSWKCFSFVSGCRENSRSQYGGIEEAALGQALGRRNHFIASDYMLRLLGATFYHNDTLWGILADPPRSDRLGEFVL